MEREQKEEDEKKISFEKMKKFLITVSFSSRCQIWEVSTKAKRSEMSGEELCVICQSDLGTEDVHHLGCNHAFHVGCIVNNLQAGNVSCPICRRLPEGVSERSFTHQRERDIRRVERLRRDNDLSAAKRAARKKCASKMLVIALKKLCKANERREKEVKRTRLAVSVRTQVRKIKKEAIREAVSKAKKEAEEKAKVILSSYGMKRLPSRPSYVHSYKVRAFEEQLIAAFRMSIDAEGNRLLKLRI